jgi:hypothetical protein
MFCQKIAEKLGGKITFAALSEGCQFNLHLNFSAAVLAEHG